MRRDQRQGRPADDARGRRRPALPGGLTAPTVTLIAADDAAGHAAAGRLLDRFNREFDEPTPGPERVAGRIAELIEAGETDVLIASGDRDDPGGIVVAGYRPAIWSAGDEAYIAELYVVPEQRRRGLGGALMEAALDRCRGRGCDYAFLGTVEGDVDAHRLYERFGFGRAVLYDREL